MNEVASTAEILCRDKGLKFGLGSVENSKVSGSKDKMRELILNLIENAIRYNVDGGTVSLSLTRDSSEAVITVTDTGIGIHSDEIPHIFERFYRVDKARSRVEGGSGLGLAICKHTAETHSGRIEATSEVGKGSVFMVYLPVNTV